ncbi:NTP pyrophosphatase (non-canonical NTP hydrolase) [Kribbella amoyensis]|uniref:NTP pyrophosphatase (Non-canonical NTP hydrolase) n=1 Tax=Kribbella amoyensis TaxID=996641 RepID=A0A561B3Q0_9ACTN|nr:NTP pyrophosphatase (non-canonical NTP hydrolase) [Kribbella amoyensis]
MTPGTSCPNARTYDEPVDLTAYQQAALRTAAPRDKQNEFLHLVLGLVGESGEIAEKVKKVIRDQDSDFTKIDIEDLKKELGDVLWYVAVLADYFDIPLNEVGEKNIEKLAGRQQRAVLGGSGDNR